jgi:hypothetical protein
VRFWRDQKKDFSDLAKLDHPMVSERLRGRRTLSLSERLADQATRLQAAIVKPADPPDYVPPDGIYAYPPR